MPDPDGIGKPLEFCSADCLYAAGHLCDGLSEAMLQELDRLITATERKAGVAR